LKERYEKLEKACRWIPVTERLPKSPTQYLCCDMKPDTTDLATMYFATTWSKAEGFYLEDGTRVYPTHWKRIIFPEPAKLALGEEKKDD